MARGRRPANEAETAKDSEMEVDRAVPDQPQDIEDDNEEDEEGGIRIGDIYLPPPPPPACTFEADGPRLIITHIVNDNFKSYLGRQVLGPFHKSFTSIIGPNGSGKSNVIDSMLFVFGYRAQKIRSKKISVLIHRSNGHENIDSCSVAVHFQKIIDKGEDEFEVVPGSELVVSRTAHRDNSSHYTVNGRRSQFKQVARLLRQHGIDLDHNRFLILQGEVEQISLMKPKAQTENESGMLEYLEDIVGSSRYKEPIELLNTRVDQLNEQRTEKLNRVKLVEKEKEELEAPKNEVLDYLRLCNKLVSLKNQALQKKIADCATVAEENEVERQKVDSEMTELKTQLEEVTERMNTQQGEMKEIQGKLSEVVREKERVDELFKQQGAQDVKINEDMKQLKDRMKKNKTALKNEAEKLSELESIPERNTAEISALTTRRDQLSADRASAEQNQQQVLAGIRHETQHLQDEKDQLESGLGGLRETVNTTKAAMDSAQCELDIYVGNKQSEQAKLEQMKCSLTTTQQQVDEKKRLLSQLDSSTTTKRSQLHQSEQQLEQLNNQLTAAQQVLSAGRGKLEEVRSALQACRGRGVVLSAVMEQKLNGALPGVYGRLGDLGSIDEKYDVAISTACGPLDNIVVDTVDTAQRCIQFLKQNQLGTATFIALDRMEKWRQQANSRIQTPENVPRLFDLVRVADDAVLTAFYFALRDTLVAKDLGQATRIGYGRQRHRVVTLRGDLIEPSGTMSGGGKRTLSGRMNTGSRSAAAAAALCSQQVSPADVELAEANIADTADKIRHLTRECQQEQETADALTKQLSKHGVDQRKFHMELQALEEKLSILEGQIKEQTVKVEQATPDPTSVKKLTATLQKATAEYEKARSSAAVLEEQVATVHEKIMQITGGKVKAAQKTLDDIVKAFDKCRSDIAKLGQAIKTSERNAAKSRDKIKSLETDQEEASKEKESLLAARTKLEEEASDVIAKIKELEERYKSLNESLTALKTRLDATVAEENKAKAAKIQFDQRIEKFVTKIKESQNLIAKYKRELDRLELQTLPDCDRREDDLCDLPALTTDDLASVQLDRLTYSITRLEEEIGKMKPDMSALEEFRKKEAVFISRVAELDEITSQRDTQRKYYDDLRKQRLNEFMSGFSIITSKLKEMYQMITLGGDAELELVDSLDPFSEGIVFSVRPPKKSWKNITNLSGGEKTLSSLALVFALHYYKPTPLYVMDEIDAALDFKNVSVVGNYIKERTKNAQFIIISLRSQMFELADRLVGIYKTYDATKSVTINPGLISRGAVAPPAVRQVPKQQEIAASE